MSLPSPVRLESPSGLAAELAANGALRRLEHRGLVLNLFPGNEMDGGPANLFLRRRARPLAWISLTGPRSPARMRADERGLDLSGEWGGLRFLASLRLAASAPAWFWHVEVENAGRAPETIDLLYAQDVALADYGLIRLNEYYVSQYVDHTPLVHPERGVVLAAWQNLAMGGRHPWCLFGSLGRGTSFATDALQLHGRETRAGRAPAGLEAERLPGERRQHEHSMAVIQDEPVVLAPGARVARGFFAWLEPDHPGATSPDDLAFVGRALELPEARPPADVGEGGAAPVATLWSERPLLAAEELDEADLVSHFGEERRAAERDGGRLLSFFAGDQSHVVLLAKERASLRPHGQILRTGGGLVPDEASLTSTVWMAGVFHSMVTQGHVSIGRFLSTTHSYLGLFRSHGQRIFVELAGGWHLLDEPSAFEMTPSGARWLYRHAQGLLEVRSWAPVDRHELRLAVRVLEGPACRFLVSHHVAVNGDDGNDAVPLRVAPDAKRGVAVSLLPDTDLGRRFPEGSFRVEPAPGTAFEQVGGDELLFADGRSRNQPFLVLVTARAEAFGLAITGRLLDPGPLEAAAGAGEARAAVDAAAAERHWREMTGPLQLRAGPEAAGAAPIEGFAQILPWFTHDALIHYLAPRGLEQYSGGGWGTRDVCQGPVELLLALGRFEPVRDILLRVFRNQNPDGDWPQWFMFFERERGIRPGDSHGDIVFWPLLALAEYLLASDDTALLEEVLPYFHPEGEARAERGALLAHVERALELMAKRVIAGTALAAYGNGDWNDSLQPVDPAFTRELCSAWTVGLQHQTLGRLAAALRRAGRLDVAERLEAVLPRIRDDFQRLLLRDGVLAHFGHARADGRVDLLLHPSDRETGVRYSLFPMVQAILADLFTREQAEHHLELIRRHLLSVDGARLFDQPLPYHGGLQRHFQRAETSTYFGREIGIMYTHAHLRYAEAMAYLGEAEAFWLALRQANPVRLREVVRSARLRQANCYTSSSDAEFRDRAEASARYAEIATGAVALEGGWRVYSSGAGIAVRLVRECLLGLRLQRSELAVDPVLPRSLDGLRAVLPVAGRPLEVVYRVGERGFGPKTLVLNGAPLDFGRLPNPWRTGGARVSMGALRERLGERANELVVELG